MRFWRYALAALDGVRPAACDLALAWLQSSQPPAIEAVLTGLVNTLSTLPEQVILVLDDYHIIDARAIYNALSSLVDHLSPQMHLIIATRADPPLPLARLRARGELIEL